MAGIFICCVIGKTTMKLVFCELSRQIMLSCLRREASKPKPKAFWKDASRNARLRKARRAAFSQHLLGWGVMPSHDKHRQTHQRHNAICNYIHRHSSVDLWSLGCVSCPQGWTRDAYGNCSIRAGEYKPDAPASPQIRSPIRIQRP